MSPRKTIARASKVLTNVVKRVECRQEVQVFSKATCIPVTARENGTQPLQQPTDSVLLRALEKIMMFFSSAVQRFSVIATRAWIPDFSASCQNSSFVLISCFWERTCLPPAANSRSSLHLLETPKGYRDRRCQPVTSTEHQTTSLVGTMQHEILTIPDSEHGSSTLLSSVTRGSKCCTKQRSRVSTNDPV